MTNAEIDQKMLTWLTLNLAQNETLKKTPNFFRIAKITDFLASFDSLQNSTQNQIQFKN